MQQTMLSTYFIMLLFGNYDDFSQYLRLNGRLCNLLRQSALLYKYSKKQIPPFTPLELTTAAYEKFVSQYIITLTRHVLIWHRTGILDLFHKGASSRSSVFTKRVNRSYHKLKPMCISIIILHMDQQQFSQCLYKLDGDMTFYLMLQTQLSEKCGKRLW